MNRIAEIRKEKKLTQKELGRLIGAAQNTICNWENSKREPDQESLSRMSKLFGVTVDYLLGLDIEKDPLTVSDEEALDKKLISLLTSLTPSEQEKTAAYVQGLIANRKD